MSRKILSPSLIVLALLITGVAMTSCSQGTSNSSSSGPTTSPSPAPTPKTGFETDLEYVRKRQYTYVWVFARKDGQPLDKDDAAYLRTNAPQVVDWVTTDERKLYVVAGTNFDLAQGNLELLKKRFNAEDYTGR